MLLISKWVLCLIMLNMLKGWSEVIQEAHGPWRSAWPFVRWNQHRLYWQCSWGNLFSKYHILLKFGRSPKKRIFSPDYQAFNKAWLISDKNWGSSSLLKILTSEILQSAPNDPKLNSNDLTRKVLYIRSSWDHESQIFSRFALRSAIYFRSCSFHDFPIDSHVKISKCHNFFFKFGRLPRKVKQPVFSHGSQCPPKVWVTLDENCRKLLLVDRQKRK